MSLEPAGPGEDSQKPRLDSHKAVYSPLDSFPIDPSLTIAPPGCNMNIFNPFKHRHVCIQCPGPQAPGDVALFAGLLGSWLHSDWKTGHQPNHPP